MVSEGSVMKDELNKRFDEAIAKAALFSQQLCKDEREKAERPRGMLPAIKVPDPEFLIKRFKASKSAGLLSRRPRPGRAGKPQALVNELAPLDFDKARVWAVISQKKSTPAKSMAELRDVQLAGIDQFTKEEFSTEKNIFYLPFKLITVFDPPLELKRPPAGRRFAAEVDFDRDIAKSKGPCWKVARGLKIVGGTDTTLYNMLFDYYKPFLSREHIEASAQFLILVKRGGIYCPIGCISVGKSSFIQIAIVPSMTGKGLGKRAISKFVTDVFPMEKVGWTSHRDNYSGLRFLFDVGGGIFENCVDDKDRVNMEGFFKPGAEVPRAMRAALQGFLPNARNGYQKWLRKTAKRRGEFSEKIEEYIGKAEVDFDRDIGKSIAEKDEVEKTRAPFGIFGGSSRYAKKIVKRITEHTTYVEPFAGSAAVLYAKEPSEKEVLADANDDIVFLHKFIKSLNGSAIEKLGRDFDWRITRVNWNRAKEMSPTSDVQRFYRILFLITSSFFSKLDFSSFNPAQETEGRVYNVRRLIKASERLRNVTIIKSDYRSTITKYDSSETFFYLDPPWPDEWYDKNKAIDLDEFVSAVKKIRGKFIAEINESAKNKEEYKKFGKIFTLGVKETKPDKGGGNKKARRLFSSNYDVRKFSSDNKRKFAAINPSGQGQYIDDPVELAEVIESYSKPIALRKPCVFAVGSLCNKGKSENDIDVLIRGPFDEETLHIIKFRLGRALDPNLSKRLQFHHDEGGPFCLSGDRVVGIEKDGVLEFKQLEEWWDSLGTYIDKGGYEIAPAANGMRTIAWSGDKAVWSKLVCLTRRMYEGEMVLLRQRWGQTEVTPNHSIYDSDGTLCTPLKINELLSLRSLPALPEISEIVLPNVEEQVGRWALQKPLNRIYTLDEMPDLLRVISAFISDGHSGPEGRVGISDGDLERLYEVAESFYRLWGFRPYVQDRRSADDHTSRLIVNRHAFGKMLMALCGSGAINKQLPHWSFNLPKTMRLLFLSELVKGDGSIRVRGSSRYRRKERRFFTASPVLLAQLSALEASVDQDFAIERNGSSAWTRYPGFCLAERGGSDGRSIIRREIRHAKEYVYDLSCEDFHNFVDGCGLVVVHNTSHVQLYDLVLVPHEDRSVKEMALAKQDDPLLDWPENPGKFDAVLQGHFRGKSYHADLRMSVDGHLVGWTITFQKAGSVPDVDTLTGGRRIAGEFNVKGSKFNKPMILPSRVLATGKARQPKVWMELGDVVIPPGEVGATRLEPGVIIEIARPKVEWGLQKPFSHEYFFTGDPKFSGTLVFRQLAGEKPEAEVDDETRTPEGQLFWTCGFAKTLLPSVLKQRSVETKSMPPLGHSAMPVSLMRGTPREFRFWEADSEAEARKVRDELVKAKLFTEKNVVMARNEYHRVEQKIFYGPYDPEPSEIEKLKTTDFALSWQYWKGQTVVRATPSRQVWHLIIAKPGDRGVWDFQLQRDPLSGEEAISALMNEGGKELLAFEGKVPPGTEVGGLLLNRTKATPSSVKIQDSGRVELLESQPSFSKLRFLGKKLKGIFTLVAEEVGSDIWQFSPGTEPARAIPKAEGTLVEKAFRVKDDGTQIWDPVDMRDGDDKGRDRTKLRPPAVFQPQKPAPRSQLRFTDPDKAAKEVFTEDLIKQGVQLEAKFNGFRAIVERWDAGIAPEVKSGGVIILTEDRKRNIAKNIPGLTKDISGIGGNFVIDAEIMAVDDDGNFLPRRELAAFRGEKPVRDENIRLMVFDALYLPGVQNITDRSMVERRRLLERWWVKQGLDGKVPRMLLPSRKVARSRSELRNGIDWASKQPGSEGAMIKQLGATYSLGGENDLVAKVKTVREIKALVVERHEVKDSPGVYNFVGAIGPIPKDQLDDWKEVVELKDKHWAIIGTTGNRKLDAKPGDVILVEVLEILLEEGPPQRIRWFGPATAVDVVPGSPSTTNEVRSMLRPTELKTKEATKRFEGMTRPIRIFKRDDGSDERFVFGVVLVPDEVDAQGEIYSVEDVRKACHSFMESYRGRFKVMHSGEVVPELIPLETYVSKREETHGGETYPVGTWFLAARVNSDELWAKIKSGEFTGWSMGGTAVRESLKDAVES